MNFSTIESGIASDVANYITIFSGAIWAWRNFASSAYLIEKNGCARWIRGERVLMPTKFAKTVARIAFRGAFNNSQMIGVWLAFVRNPIFDSLWTDMPPSSAPLAPRPDATLASQLDAPQTQEPVRNRVRNTPLYSLVRQDIAAGMKSILFKRKLVIRTW